MTNLMNRFRRIAGQTSLVKDDRGLSTVEYVIILVLIAAAAVGAWQSLGTTVKEKIRTSDAAVKSVEITNGDVK